MKEIVVGGGEERRERGYDTSYLKCVNIFIHNVHYCKAQ